ncbi:hypothetical protein HMPREF0083_01538 [Aneurinibacillus aneurinilyticus ATCC 12856]|uniref:Uncharacterized protein n=1 Tax=Aneurinibacillus aneurinilyticus ATCC 12856 TaxID=649747 RepID=U1YHX4_ANEAE|nr:hypothetical protein HMPREF0083_01538 [Aneurinibacillus aneurinilyticus ATCC 12856]
MPLFDLPAVVVELLKSSKQVFLLFSEFLPSNHVIMSKSYID